MTITALLAVLMGPREAFSLAPARNGRELSPNRKDAEMKPEQGNAALACKLGRLGAGLAIAVGLLTGLAATQPRQAGASDDLGAPTLLEVNVGGDSAYLSFRDNSSLESGYLVYGYVGQTYAAFANRPGVPGEGRTATISIEHVNPNLSYCFTAFSADVGPDGNLETDSPASNQICTTPTSTPKPAAQPASPPLSTSSPYLSQFCVACPEHSAPALPDLSIVDIRAESSGQPVTGETPIYDIVVANTGAKVPGGQIQVQFSITGAVQYYNIVQKPAGFTCGGGSPAICQGPIGGSGDSPSATSVTFRVQAYAVKSGIGALSADADPNNVVVESDETNNGRTLPITVK
jgi:hypothetical protein